jgi:hypothetical protein
MKDEMTLPANNDFCAWKHFTNHPDYNSTGPSENAPKTPLGSIEKI